MTAWWQPGAWLPGPAALRGPPGTIDALLWAAGQAWPAAAGQRSLRSWRSGMLLAGGRTWRRAPSRAWMLPVPGGRPAGPARRFVIRPRPKWAAGPRRRPPPGTAARRDAPRVCPAWSAGCLL